MLNKTGHRSVAALFAALARIDPDDRDAAVAQLKQAIVSYDPDNLRVLRDLLLDGARLRMQEAQVVMQRLVRPEQSALGNQIPVAWAFAPSQACLIWCHYSRMILVQSGPKMGPGSSGAAREIRPFCSSQLHASESNASIFCRCCGG
jgi:hypothetical protein